MALAPRLLARFGPRILAVSGLALAFASILPALVGSQLGLAVVLLMMGATMSLCDILSNIRISDIEAREGRSLMNLNHAIYSLSMAAVAALMGLMRGAGVNHIQAALVVVLIIMLMAWGMRGLRPGPRPSMTADPHQQKAGIAPWLVILPGAAILWLCFLAENGVESWTALHIERNLGVSGGIGAFGPAMFGLAMGLARLAGQGATRLLGEVRLIALSVCLAIIGALMLSLAGNLGVAIVGAAAAGLGVAVVVPTANSLIARTVTANQRASAISRAWLIGFTGFFIGPPALGLISEAAGLRVAFAGVALLVALILPALWLLTRRLRA